MYLHSSSSKPPPQESVTFTISEIPFGPWTGDADKDIIIYSIETLPCGGNGVHPPNTFHYAFGQVYHRETSGPGHIIFEFDQLIGAVNHLFVNLFPLLLVCFSAKFWVQVLQRDADDICGTPHGHTGVSMLAKTHQ